MERGRSALHKRAPGDVSSKTLVQMVTLAILPAMIVIILLLVQNERDTNAELYEVNAQMSAQLAGAIRSYCDQVEETPLYIQNNTGLMIFLSKRYRAGLDYATYACGIYDQLHYITSVSGKNKLFLFMDNDSIPQAFDLLYRDDYLLEDSMFKSLLQDEALSSAWYYLDRAAIYPPYHPFKASEDSLLYLHKLRPVNFPMAGFAAVRVPLMALVEATSGSMARNCEQKGNLLTFNMTDQPLPEQIVEQMLRSDQTQTTIPGALLTLTQVEGLPIVILIATARVSRMSNYLIAALVMLLTVPLLNFVVVRYCWQLVHAIENLVRQVRRAIVDDIGFRLTPSSNHSLNVVSERINTLLERMSGLLEERVRQESAVRDAQLRALQHQINPHFIYNTMEMLAGRLEMRGMFEESDALTDFAYLFRYNINASNQPTTLHSELTNVERYMGMHSLLRQDVRLSLDVDDTLRDMPMPRFVLQPLVENSLEHAGHGKNGMLTVTVSAQRMGSMAHIAVSDDGIGMDAGQLEALQQSLLAQEEGLEAGDSIGIHNIHTRIRLLYGSMLQVHSVQNEGMRVFFDIPL